MTKRTTALAMATLLGSDAHYHNQSMREENIMTDYRPTTAAAWLKEAKESVQHAIECLGQMAGIAEVAQVALAEMLVKRGMAWWAFAAGERWQQLIDGKDEAVALIQKLKALDWEGLKHCEPENWETWKGEAAAALDRAR